MDAIGGRRRPGRRWLGRRWIGRRWIGGRWLGGRWLGWFGWLAMGTGAAWVVVRVAGLEHGPLVQLLAFTPYAAVLALVPLAAAVASRRWWASALGAAVAGMLICLVVPRAVPGATRRRPGPPVRVESVHPMAPYALRAVADWRRDLATEPPASPAGPVRILAGDFNSTLDHAPLRALLATGYADAADRTGAGLLGTWGPYDGDPIPPVTIDHVLVDRRIAVRAVVVRPLPPSDHRTLLADLTLPAG